MTVHEMMCHLTDCYQLATGERPVALIRRPWFGAALKWVALYLPLTWPHGAPTLPDVDPLHTGTQPTEFPADRARLEQAVGTFYEAASHGRCGRHPVFGRVSEAQWLRWGYSHADHHLRQFGA